MKPAWEDLAVFLGDFGVDVVVGGVSLRGIWREAARDLEVGHTDLATQVPTLRITAAAATTHAAALRKGAAATIDGRSWRLVSSPSLDGTGWAFLEFREGA